jgi:hypothetical protein
VEPSVLESANALAGRLSHSALAAGKRLAFVLSRRVSKNISADR